MGKAANGNVKVKAVLVVAGGLLVSGGGWWLNRVDSQATAQGVTLTEHAVDIAATKATLSGVREDVKRVEKKLDESADKLDEILRKVQ